MGLLDAIREARRRAAAILDGRRLAWLGRKRPGYNPARRLKRLAMRQQGLSPRQFRYRQREAKRGQK